MSATQDYRTIIQEILLQHAALKPSHGNLEKQPIFDIVRDHYTVVTVGWHGYKRYCGSTIHVDIKDGKIWIQHDGTEVGVANELEERGVPKEDIVLGFLYPYRFPESVAV
jgi:hypothetical protein